MGRSKKVHVSVYLGGIYEEVTSEAERQERSRAWLLIRAWEIARDRVRALPAGPPKEES